MKSKHKTTRFDYSKYESDDYWADHDVYEEYEFWGFHTKSGRLHIDTKRYKKACESVGIEDFMPAGMFDQRGTPYYEPSKICRYDYKVNLFRDLLRSLQSDWENEYKPLFDKIKSPKDVESEYYENAIQYTSCSDDIEDIAVDSKIAAIKRGTKYLQVIQSLYCQFIQKIATEVDRAILIFMSESGWKKEEYKMSEFIHFSKNLSEKRGGANLKELIEFKSYHLLNLLNNFLKHNSLKSYKLLKKYFPNNVASTENGKAKKKYENGMYAADWIIIEPHYIDGLLGKLITFFEYYCRTHLGEDTSRARWDYDDYFYAAYEQLKNPSKYLGID